MIPTLTWFPPAFSQEPSETWARDIVRWIREASDAGVILVDSGDVLIGLARTLSKSWAPRHQKELEVLLVTMKRQHRLIALPCGVASAGATQPCRVTADLTSSSIRGAAIRPSVCDCEEMYCQAMSDTAVPVDIEDERDFSNLLHRKGEIVKEGGWRKEDFADQILAPILRYTQSVIVYDRLLGDTSVNIPFDGVVKVKDNFSDGIEWLLHVFRESSIYRKLSVVILTEVAERKVSPGQMNAVERDLVLWAKRRLGRKDMEIELRVQRAVNTPRGRHFADRKPMHHDRFLITDQFGINIGRGVDLLDRSGYSIGSTSFGVMGSAVSVRETLEIQ
jgi:hypothetical protein